MARRERSSSHDNKIEKPKEGQFGSISDVQKNRTGSGGWRIGSVGKAAGKAIQKINLGRMIDQMEECQELADALEAVNAETQDEINFREIKREAEVACMLEVRKHLEVFVVEHPEATYEQWIMELHPDNINEKVPQTIDHRFYVEDSDHRRLWNINLTRGGGKRSYVHALSGDDLPIYNQQKKQPSFVNRRSKDKQPKDTHEADLDQYAPQHHLHDDEDELDVDVSDPMGSLDISMSFTYDPKKNKDPRFEQQLDELRRRRSSAGSVSNDSLGLDYDGSHLFPQPPSSSRNANPKDKNKDRSQSPKSQTNSNNDAAEPLDNIPPSSSRQNKRNDIHEPDPYKDLGFDRDDEDDDALENKPQPQLSSEPRNTSRRRSSNSSYRDDDDDTDDHDHLQPDPYKDLGFIPDDEEEEEDELEEPSPIHEQLQSKRNSESRSSGSRNSYRGEDHQPDPYQDLGFDRDVEEDLDDEPNLFPPSVPVVTDKSPSPSFTPAAQDDVTAPQSQTATTTPEQQTKNPTSTTTTTSSTGGGGGAPRFDTIETRLHLENYITQNPQCEYEHWIGEYYPHLVSRNLTTGDVLILGEEDAFYDERSEFRRLWNIHLAKGGGRRTYVSARRY